MKTIVGKSQLKKIIGYLFVVCFFFGTPKTTAQNKTITEYQPYFATGTYQQKKVVILRKYHSSMKTKSIDMYTIEMDYGLKNIGLLKTKNALSNSAFSNNRI